MYPTSFQYYTYNSVLFCQNTLLNALQLKTYLGQHRTIHALRLKRRSGGSPRQEPPQAAVALRSASLRLGVRHGICVAKMLDKTSSIICAFGLAPAAPRSPYRHLELCGIALDSLNFEWGPMCFAFEIMLYQKENNQGYFSVGVPQGCPGSDQSRNTAA